MKLAVWIVCLSSLFALAGCAGQIVSPIDVRNPLDPRLTYDGPITLSIKNGKTLAGTNLGYQGKSQDGRSLVVIGGLQAAKQSGDSVNYTGQPMPGVKLQLNTRVTTYDQNTVNLVGTIHLDIAQSHPEAGTLSTDLIAAFGGIPVQYNVAKGDAVPGTLIQYVGQSEQGAQFSNVGEYPFRQAFDSVVWTGHLREKLGLKLDLRLLSSSEEGAIVAGTAQILFER